MASPKEIDDSVTVAARHAVDAGMRILDKVKPGWWRMVKLEKLDMMNPNRCILGQVFKHNTSYRNPNGFWAGLDAIMVKLGQGVDSDSVGFDAKYGCYDYTSLKAAWRRVINSRKARARRRAKQAKN